MGLLGNGSSALWLDFVLVGEGGRRGRAEPRQTAERGQTRHRGRANTRAPLQTHDLLPSRIELSVALTVHR